ncbi:thiol-disulfide oxidoreductase DCC family protein [Kurthia senegalensis]|uniref:thiol-disulfide oxidoreductase DCC family protein n=1 Tax=Kurthia senegalensis TaxID=1033740 RepID=UPI00028A39D5|nr:DCC1-like thiol-disulfide oxidoreductase family protein [Kurthia senegalensis]
MDKPILFYDGACGFCNRSVQFILDHERTDELHFASLQSDFAKQSLPQEHWENLDSIVVLDGNHIYTKAKAVFFIANYLKIPFRWAYAGKYLPEWPFNKAYEFLAKNRYSLSQSRKSCQLLSQKQRKRFITS